MEAKLPNKQDINDNSIEVVYLNSTNSTGKQLEEVITLESTPNEDNQILEAEPLATHETEEHEGGPPSSISDINPRDFYDPSEIWGQNSSQREGCVREEFQVVMYW